MGITHECGLRVGNVYSLQSVGDAVTCLFNIHYLLLPSESSPAARYTVIENNNGLRFDV